MAPFAMPPKPPAKKATLRRRKSSVCQNHALKFAIVAFGNSRVTTRKPESIFTQFVPHPAAPRSHLLSCNSSWLVLKDPALIADSDLIDGELMSIIPYPVSRKPCHRGSIQIFWTSCKVCSSSVNPLVRIRLEECTHKLMTSQMVLLEKPNPPGYQPSPE